MSGTDTQPQASGEGLLDRYVNRLALAFGGAVLAPLAFAAVAYVRVIAPIGDPGLRSAVLSSFVGLLLTAVLSLALVAVTVGSNTAITLRLLSSKAGRIEAGDMDVRFDTDRADEFGDLARSLASMRDALDRRIEESERRRRESERLNEHMQAKAEHYEAVLEDVMDGDLSRRADPTSENEALEAIGDSINATVTELESASENVAREVERLSANSEEVAAAARELADTSERAAETGVQGRASAESAIEEMELVEDTAEEAVDEIQTLRREMAEIEETVGAITEVARRTNILAVNARIESSRSESGSQGYSVVADEIRDLAEETQRAAKQIEGRIEDLRAQTEETAVDITDTRERADEAARTVRDAADAFDRLVEYVEDVDTNAQAIDDATDVQADSVESVADAVEDLGSMRDRLDDRPRTTAADHGFEPVTQD